MDKRKLVFFVPKLDDGGAEKHAVKLANELKNMGYECEFLVIEKGGRYEKLLHSEITVNKLNSYNYKSSTLSLISALPSLVRQLRYEKDGLYISIMLRPSLLLLLATILVWSRVNVMPLLQVSISETHYKKQNLLAKIELMGVRLLLPRSEKIIAISEGVKEEFINTQPRLREKTTVIHNIASVENAGTTPKKDYIKSPVTFLACGRLTAQKDYPTMLRALALLDSRFKEWSLTILGSGELQVQLKQLVKELKIIDKIKFEGFVDNPTPYYEKSDIFLLSSRWEGFGNVIVEAMAAGTPVVACDCPHGPGEIIKHGVNGLLVPVSNTRKFSDAIYDLIHDEELYASLSDKGYLRSIDFSPNAIAKKYASELDKI